MSKLGCSCGYVIVDQTDDLPYKGTIIVDQDKDKVFDTLTATLVDFINAIQKAHRAEWLADYFMTHNPELYRNSQDNTSAIYHLVARVVSRYERQICQCENCGKIYIQESNTSNQFRSFSPDGDNWKRILAASDNK